MEMHHKLRRGKIFKTTTIRTLLDTAIPFSVLHTPQFYTDNSSSDLGYDTWVNFIDFFGA